MLNYSKRYWVCINYTILWIGSIKSLLLLFVSHRSTLSASKIKSMAPQIMMNSECTLTGCTSRHIYYVFHMSDATCWKDCVIVVDLVKNSNISTIWAKKIINKFQIKDNLNFRDVFLIFEIWAKCVFWYVFYIFLNTWNTGLTTLKNQILGIYNKWYTDYIFILVIPRL